MNNMQINDSTLLSKYMQGDEEAFRVLVERHQSRIFTTIHLIVKDQYIAEDLMQEAFIKAIRTIKGGNYNEEGKFLPWILRIAHNLAIDHFRKQKRYPTIITEAGGNVFDTLAFSEESFEDVQVKKDTYSKMKTCITQLPQTQKEVLIMRHYMKMSFKEIAEATGVSINTALGRMRYALINLRKKMQTTDLAYDSNIYPE